jgi:hypothetical protein
MGRIDNADLKLDYERALVGMAIFSNRAKWRSFSECMPPCAQKELDTPDIVRDGIFRQR